MIGFLERKMDEKKGLNVALVGGGYIGVEVAAALAGWEGIASITILNRDPNLLARVFDKKRDGDILKIMEDRLCANGKIKVFNSTNITNITKSGSNVSGFTLDGKTELSNLDCVILGVGARPNTNVLPDHFLNKNFVDVDGNFKVKNAAQDGIYAFGDFA